MTSNFYPEMGEQAKDGTQIIATCSYAGGYRLKTWLKLEGRGVKQTGTSDLGPNAGRPIYQVTKAAFDKIKTQYNVAFESLL